MTRLTRTFSKPTLRIISDSVDAEGKNQLVEEMRRPCLVTVT